MASPTLPSESLFSSDIWTTTDPLLATIKPSHNLPAENPSHSRVNSKDTTSEKTIIAPSQPSPGKPLPLRNKSNSLSFPVLINTATTDRPPSNQRRKPTKSKHPLRIHVPQSDDTNFLTTLAAQERHVLELKEELAKAEESLTKLKSQWASHESRRRETEARRLHRMKSLRSADGSADGSASAFPSSAGGMSTPREVFEEMLKRKASWENTKRSPRQRRFSGSRHMRALSLVSSEMLAKYVEQSQTQSGEKQEHTRASYPLDNTEKIPPTPDLIHEDDEETTDGATNSQRSSESPNQSQHRVRASMQMAADFREGLWTFFEDLKQATYGEDARGMDRHMRAGSRPDAQIRREMQSRNNMPLPSRPQKRTVRRQTWQIRPRESDESLIDVDGTQQKLPAGQDSPRRSRPIMPARNATVPADTPQGTPRLVKDADGEVWQSWDSPRMESRATTPNPPHPERKDSLDSTARRLALEEGKQRGSLPWPALSKLKPVRFTRTASQLMDEWEKSLSPPSAYQQVQQIQRQHDDGRVSSRSASPRPVSKRSNSRLDEAYA